MQQAVWNSENQLSDSIKRGFPEQNFHDGQFHWKTESSQMTFTQHYDSWHTFSQHTGGIQRHPGKSYKATIADGAKWQ